jgi:hypothetical protein
MENNMGNFGTIILDKIEYLKNKKNPTAEDKAILAALMPNKKIKMPKFKKELLGCNGKYEGEKEEIDPKTGKKEKVLCYSFSDYSKYNPAPKKKKIKKNNKEK